MNKNTHYVRKYTTQIFYMEIYCLGVGAYPHALKGVVPFTPQLGCMFVGFAVIHSVRACWFL